MSEREHKTLLLEELKRLDSKQEKEDFADRIGISLGGLQQVAYGCRPCQIHHAVRIDRETDGRVPMAYMMPSIDWEYLNKVVIERAVNDPEWREQIRRLLKRAKRAV